jgi:hypothetical protein
MDDDLVKAIDAYVRMVERFVATGFTSTKDKIGNPRNAISLILVFNRHLIISTSKSTILL